MDILRYGSLILFKFLAAVAFGAAYAVAVAFVGYEAGLFQDDSPVEDVLFIVFVASVVIVSFLFIVCKLFGWSGLWMKVVKGVVWLIASFALMVAAYFAYVEFGMMRKEYTILKIIMIVLGLVLACYIAYIVLSLLVNFIGMAFELMASYSPGGRSLLFEEALHSGYSKPQIRVFVNELNDDTVLVSRALILPSFILYVMPLLVFALMLFDLW